ncbi:MAG: hypothetical protein ACLSGX_01305 [Pseudoruminococcus massiliensis]|uniref:hypothetical protein n=1 Tax=Pseudoruminococcus massiliensis TaxID=2086583 RepID=UPI003996B383|nr:hypothetical protein [Oscillospiraceae bacterium]
MVVRIFVENLDFVVTTFNKAVDDWCEKQIQYLCQPILHYFGTLNKLRDTTI